MNINQLSLLAPEWLSFLLILPVIWWLLRLLPPLPQKIILPSVMLLRGLVTTVKTPETPPVWLLILRLLSITLIIIAFAKPVIDAHPMSIDKGGLLILLDNDWAAARDWDARLEYLRNSLHEMERQKRDVFLMPTTPNTSGAALSILGPYDAKRAISEIENISPQPWGADWVSARELLNKFAPGQTTSSLWLTSGLGGSAANNLIKALEQRGSLKLVNDETVPIYTLSTSSMDDNNITINSHRLNTEGEETISVVGYGQDDQKISDTTLTFHHGAPDTSSPLGLLPTEARNQIIRFQIEGSRTAASTFLLDNDWQTVTVGIVGDRAELDKHSLLSGLFYLDRALKPFADIRLDQLGPLLKDNPALLFMDGHTLDEENAESLLKWIKKGGLFVRFADEDFTVNSETTDQEIMPVILRLGDRALGGALSWSVPQKLQKFDLPGPFVGLAIPDDVTINRQMLAEPSPDLRSKTWATLTDGTPLVTAKSLGMGLSIFFHVPPHAGWSNLPLSGLFVEMLRRILDLSHNTSHDFSSYQSLEPLRVLDAYGELVKPEATALPLETSNLSLTLPGPDHPAGMYGNKNFQRGFNLGPSVKQAPALRGPKVESMSFKSSEIDMAPYLLFLAALLLLSDFIISLYLRGYFAKRNVSALAIIFFFIFTNTSVHAATSDQAAFELTSKTWLGYIKSGDVGVDAVAKAGLKGLSRALVRRTSIEQIDVAEVNPNFDDLTFYALIYWPLTSNSGSLTSFALAHINDYLHHGGVILFDTMQGETSSPGALRTLLRGVDIPVLEAVPINHVLKRSYYLLNDFPGRYNQSDFWIEPEDASTHDGVATVLFGENDYAAAWATDETGRFLYPCIPDGEPQREMAFRFGINLVMYALTGNYKSDQLHTDALLKRMGK